MFGFFLGLIVIQIEAIIIVAHDLNGLLHIRVNVQHFTFYLTGESLSPAIADVLLLHSSCIVLDILNPAETGDLFGHKELLLFREPLIEFLLVR